MPAPTSTLGEGMDMEVLSALISMGMSYEQARAIAADPIALGALSGAPTLEAPIPQQDRAGVQQSVNRDIEAQQELERASYERSQEPFRLTPEQQATEDRFGNDMSWLDPYFQRSATTVAPVTSQDALQYGTTADPQAQAQERQAIDQLFQRANAGPSAGEQDGLNQQRRAIEGLFGTAASGPSDGENRALGTQQRAIDRMFGVADEGATGDERAALDMAMGTARNLTQRAGQGATGEERLALRDQSQAAQDLLDRGRAGATAEERTAVGDQRRAMDRLFGDYEQGASDVELEAQGTQREAMNELMGVWKGGGATALERARRAKARSESENWLLGQREADMQDLAERGMGGGGAEIAALARDRQDAASRLSMADLETDAALEERAMQALLGGSGVAGELLSGEGNIQARRLQQLLSAGGAARGISDTLGGIEGRSTQQLAAGGGMVGDVARTYGDIEGRSTQQLLGAGGMAGDVAGAYGDIEARGLEALRGASQGAASMAGTYGDVEARALQALIGANAGASSYTSNYGDIESRALEALMGARAGATDLRAGSDRYVQQNADRLFDASTFNAEMIDSAARDNQEFVQNAYRDTMADRLRWDMQTRQLQTGAAGSLFGSDVQENEFGYGQGYDTAASDVGAANRAQTNSNNTTIAAHSGTAPVIYDAQGGVVEAGQAGLRTGGQTIQQAGQAGLTYVSGGMSGLTGMGRQTGSSGVTNPDDENNPYRNDRY